MISEQDRDAIGGAVDAMEAEGFVMGPGWEAAHTLAQAHEGEALFDRLHALCHRIEGDVGNAGYWYRRAGSKVFDGPFAEEAQDIRRQIEI